MTVWNPRPAEAGEQAQIDYGQLGRWLDPVTGKLRTVWAFVMVLACSRHMFVRPVLKMDQRSWTECHVAAFEFFGGVPARLVPDNLKTGVDKPDLYDPKINRSYAELAAHYGCLIDPARALKPRDKARVERPMPYVRDSFWRGREFASLPQMQAEAVRWSLEVAGRRHCRPLEGAAPAAVFEAVEKDALRPLPGEPFVLATWATAKIGPDIHAQVEKVLYSVPWRHIGKTADVRVTATMVQFFIGGDLVKTHPAQGPRASRPTSATTRRRRSRSTCGPRPGAGRRPPASARPASRSSRELLAENALYRLRSAQGVIGLADKHDPAGSRPPAPRRSPPATRPTGRSRASWPPAPSATSCPLRPGTAARPAFLRGPASFANVIPMPGTIPSDAVTPANADGDDVMTTAVTVTDRSALASALRDLKLSGMLDTLDARLAQAHAGELGHLDFLQVLCQDEISRRAVHVPAAPDPPRPVRDRGHPRRVRLRRRPEAARRPDPRPRRPALAGRPASPSSSTGPVGVGKSHVAQALAHLAIRAGAEARFMKTSRALAHLAGGRADRTWDKRLAELTRPAVLVLDDFAMRELTAAQADDLYELITERAGKSLILTSNRAPADWYPLFPNPVVAESLLDRLINTSHQVFMNGPSYRPNKRPGRVVPTGNTSGS